MANSRRRERGGLDAWPGYVDALSTLLMVIIFVLMVFVLAQAFLGATLSTRDRALERLNRQMAEMGEALSLERGNAEELRATLTRAQAEIAANAAARDTAIAQLSLLRAERDRLGGERDSARGERESLTARIADLETANRSREDRLGALERQLAEARARAESVGGEAARTIRDLNEARRQMEALRAEATRLDTQVRADRATIEARLADLARLSEQVRAMTALRDEMERQAEAAMARASVEEAARRQAEQNAAQRAEQARIALARATDEEGRRRAAEQAAARSAETSEAEAARRRQAEQLAARSAETSEAARLRAEAEAARRSQAEQLAARSAETSEAARARADAEAARRAEAERLATRSAEASEAAHARAELEAGLRANAERLAEERAEEGQRYARLADSARAQAAQLSRDLTALRNELSRLAAALEAAEDAGRGKDAQITLLGQRLNAALAERVEELQRYRSDFFGRLRDVLGNRPELRIVGDRFVFQSELLFPIGSAELSAAGAQQLRELARVLLAITARIPPDLAWIMRVDGHADRTPIRTARFASNWELSAARAIAVAQLLVAEGLASNRVAATAFGDTQPLDPGETPEAFARNRRIELRLTDR